MFEILTVCTGNICRSPLAEHLLRARLAPYSPVIASAGTRGLASAPMTDEAVQLAVELGVPAEVTASHRSRFLLDAMLQQPDLILTMTRDHRREVAELAPSRLRSTFTIREFARIASGMSDDELRAAAAEGGTDAATRVRVMGMAVAAQRGLAMPAPTPDDDDVIDPYGRSWQTYQLSASQLTPAIDQVVRAIRLAVERPS